jgi:hypothetical protein
MVRAEGIQTLCTDLFAAYPPPWQEGISLRFEKTALLTGVEERGSEATNWYRNSAEAPLSPAAQVHGNQSFIPCCLSASCKVVQPVEE